MRLHALKSQLIAVTAWFPMLGSVVVTTAGLVSGRLPLLAVGLGALAITLLVRCWKWSIAAKANANSTTASGPSLDEEAALTPQSPQASGGETDLTALILEMLTRGRYALLLRRQIVGGLSAEQLDCTRQALADGMVVVPAGEVMLSDGESTADDGRFTDDEVDRFRLARVPVEDFFLDRYLVSNGQFQQFVSAGGYASKLFQSSLSPAAGERGQF